jgi:DNA-binding beta-propeller fold protein YncE
MRTVTSRVKHGMRAHAWAWALAWACAWAIAPAGPRGGLRAQAAPEPPRGDYWVYVGAESADLLHRIRFGPAGTVVEKTIRVGEIPTEMEGPHGLATSPDGRFLYMTTGHGVPDGKLWKFAAGPDTLVGEPIFLGMFPASIDVTPDGLYTFSSNFNLHGDMVPSTMSVVYTRDNTEVARIVTCVMPHGSRIEPRGEFHYSACMMDDQLVEIDTRSFQVSRRFSVAAGSEGALPTEAGATDHAAHGASSAAPGAAPNAPPVDPAQVGYQGERHTMAPNSCSPTWAQPSSDGGRVFVACNKSDVILEIDRAGWRVLRRLSTGRGPYNLAVTPDGRLLLATLKQGAMLEVFDLASGRSLARLPTSTTLAHGVVATPDSRYAFVSSEGVGAQPGKVDVYDLGALVRVGGADVGQQASGVAFWKSEPAPAR